MTAGQVEVKGPAGTWYELRAAASTAIDPAVRDYRAAADLALRLYPRPIARVVHAELHEWCTYGYRLGISPAVAPLFAQVMADAREAGLA